MFNEDFKYIIRSSLITIFPVFIIIILTEYILGFILSKEVDIEYVDITIRSVFFSQTIGIFNLLKFQKGVKKRDEFEKIETLRIVALNTLLYLVAVIIVMFLLSNFANYITNYLIKSSKDLNYLTTKIFTNIIMLILIALYKLKIARDIIQKN
ncbi:MAG: hypothetical protein ACOVNU_06040 [Candidatus Kapaibacteriota bacterium]|jgi:hypothetical protein